MRKVLSDLGCPAETHGYLGDGVYCGIDGAGQVWLAVDRYGTPHTIALDTDVQADLWRYIKSWEARHGHARNPGRAAGDKTL